MTTRAYRRVLPLLLLLVPAACSDEPEACFDSEAFLSTSVDPPTANLMPGEQATFVLIFTFSDATTMTADELPCDAVTAWSSDDEAVATVDDGVVTAVAVGETEIAATFEGTDPASAVVQVIAAGP